MNLYRKEDLVKILNNYSARFEEEFKYGYDHRSTLKDIFYIKEGLINVSGTPEQGYSVIFYFENGVSITPQRFSKLNNVVPGYIPYNKVSEERNMI